MTNRRSFLVSLLILSAAASPVLAQKATKEGAVGLWKSTSGNTFLIPPSYESFVIIITFANGKKSLGHGTWITIPRHFTYKVEGFPETFTAKFDPRNPNELHVTSEGQNTIWLRVDN